MRRAILAIVFLLALAAIPLGYTGSIVAHGEQPHISATDGKTGDTVEVILALQRSRALHVFNAVTLETPGYFVAGNVDRSLGVSPDGHTLFFEQASESGGCCALFTLDLETQKMCRVGGSNTWAITPDSHVIFMQYSNAGIEVFNARTLARMPKIAVYGGPYTFYPSPDSRWLFALAYFRGPYLDIFDIERGELIRGLPVTEGKFPRGVWLDDEFYCFSHDGKQVLLWKVTAETSALEPPVTVPLPDLANRGNPVWLEPIAVGGRLALYELFGMKLDRRRHNPEAATLPGGLFIIDPSIGGVIAHIAPSVHFARVVASADGQWLYGMDSAGPDWNGPARLLKIDAGSGKVSEERVLEGNVWSIAVAKIPGRFLPHGEVQARRCEDGSQQGQNR